MLLYLPTTVSMQTQTLMLSFDNTEIAFAYKSEKELHKSNFLFKLINNNTLVNIGTRLTPLAFKLHLPINSIVKSTIFNHFCGGENLNESLLVINKLAKFNVGTILDYGVEGKQSDEDFDHAVEEFLKAIIFAGGNKNVPFLSLKITGIARLTLLEKIADKKSLSESETVEWNRVKGRMHRICKCAFDNGKSMMIDAEETWIQQPVDDLVEEMSRFYNKERAVVYNTIQHYRHDRLSFLEMSFKKAKAENYILALKLVRGAYMEKERARAIKMNYPSPINADKISTDKDYNAGVQFCLNNINDISVCVASHNENSNLLAAKFLIDKQLPHDHPNVHFSQLLGMSDHITFNLANAGFNVTKYVPYGPVKDVVPYLMRRAQENTSVSGQMGRELSLLKKELTRRKK
ncbi:proline dehydrogenase [Bacteroidota bacterium]|nr:proline dehydrogenase [Bacteroidota bacterium]